MYLNSGIEISNIKTHFSSLCSRNNNNDNGEFISKIRVYNFFAINEIKNWTISDLTFYFKENKLRLIFVNGAHGLWNQTVDVELPKLQGFLNL